MEKDCGNRSIRCYRLVTVDRAHRRAHCGWVLGTNFNSISSDSDIGRGTKAGKQQGSTLIQRHDTGPHRCLLSSPPPPLPIYLPLATCKLAKRIAKNVSQTHYSFRYLDGIIVPSSLYYLIKMHRTAENEATTANKIQLYAIAISFKIKLKSRFLTRVHRLHFDVESKVL